MQDEKRENRLLNENEDLREDNRNLRAMHENHFEFPASWKLREQLTKVLSLLMTVDYLRHEQLQTMLTHSSEDAAATVISSLRTKLKRFGIRIVNHHSLGFAISKADKEKLRRFAIEQKDR